MKDVGMEPGSPISSKGQQKNTANMVVGPTLTSNKECLQDCSTAKVLPGSEAWSILT